MIHAALAARGDEPFLRFTDGSTEPASATLATIDAHVERLQAFGLVPGDVVALHALNRADVVRMTLATIAAGFVAWPLSYRDPPHVIAQQLSESRARVVISGATDRMATRDDSDTRWQLPGVATLLRTTGSTGRAKLAAHRMASHVASAEAAINATHFNADDAWLLSLPLFHVGGMAIVFRALLGKGVLALPPKAMTTENALTALQPTHMSVVATQLQRILASPTAREEAARCRCVLVGGGPVSIGLRRRALEAGIPLAVCYGSTETAAFVVASDDADIVARPRSAGRPLQDRVVELSDDGEILVGGPTVLAGYVEGDELVDVTDAEGRYATGDVGRFGDDGVLYILGRRDRMFISGGENVQPEEIETALEELKGIEQAVVVDIESEEFGRRPVAFLVLHEGVTLAATKITKQLRERLPGFKIPDAIWHLPTSARLGPKPDLLGLARMAADPERHLLHAL